MTQDNKDKINILYDEINEDNFDIVDQLVASDYRSKTEACEVSPETLKTSCQNMNEGFTDLTRTEVLSISEGDFVATFHIYTGRKVSDGKYASLLSIDTYLMENGLFKEHWGVMAEKASPPKGLIGSGN